MDKLKGDKNSIVDSMQTHTHADTIAQKMASPNKMKLDEVKDALNKQFDVSILDMSGKSLPDLRKKLVDFEKERAEGGDIESQQIQKQMEQDRIQSQRQLEEDKKQQDELKEQERLQKKEKIKDIIEELRKNKKQDYPIEEKINKELINIKANKNNILLNKILSENQDLQKLQKELNSKQKEDFNLYLQKAYKNDITYNNDFKQIKNPLERKEFIENVLQTRLQRILNKKDIQMDKERVNIKQPILKDEIKEYSTFKMNPKSVFRIRQICQ